jgi:hypothetical protein
MSLRGSINKKICMNLALAWAVFGCAQLTSLRVTAFGAKAPRQTIDREEQRYYANAHTYLDDTPAQIVLQIPELKSFRPDANQDELPVILDKTGAAVNEFFKNIANVIAREKIVEQKITSDHLGGRQDVEDNYLVLRHGDDTHADIEECRVDAHGKRIDEVGLEKGFFVTSDFALSSVHFLPEYQANSRFRILGEQKVDGRDAFVVGFAQEPGRSVISTTIQGNWKEKPYLVHVLNQGVAWIDKNDFKILRVRTDLLAPRRDIGLLRLTTEVDYAAETLADVTSPVWLIHEMRIYAHFSRVYMTSEGTSIFEAAFRNEHVLTDYRHYGVNATVGGQAVTAAQSHPENKEDATNGRLYLKVPAQISNRAAATYVEAPLEEVVKEVTDLKSLRANVDQNPLPAILRKTGARVDEMLANIVDVSAREKIVQARLDNRFRVIASHNTEGNYLIVHRGGKTGLDIEEYRTDASGNRTNTAGPSSTGYFVTSGFALDCNYFSSDFQRESDFRYLGTQKIGGREAYVVAFAQKPSKATLTVAFRERDGTAQAAFVQGIAWIDEGTSQIVRLRSDLLAPLYTVGLDRLTTDVRFSEVRLQDMAAPLWLPREVSVRIFMNQYSFENADYYEQIYENGHRYANYQRFRVGVKVGP